MDKSLMFSSNKQDWETPQWLFEELDSEFDFVLDAAANENNSKCQEYYTEETNSLKQDWSKFDSIYINPPYDSKKQNEFIKKAYETNKEYGNTIVLLIPARTDTKRWHDFIFEKAEVRFLKGRLNFETNGEPHKNPAPFPSAIVIYKGNKK